MDAVLGLPEQFEAGARAAGEVGGNATGAHCVLVCGMGGSAFPGDFLGLFARPRGVPVFVSRDYEVRDFPLGPDVLAIVSSFSGDTEETLSTLAQVHAAGCRVVTVSAGGRLEAEARRLGVAHVHLERPNPSFQPRAAMGYFFGAFATILGNAGLLDEVPAALATLANGLRLVDLDETASGLAERLWDRIPVVYGTGAFTETAARVIKIKLNENAKMPAFFNALPEANHNELVGYTRLTGPFSAILLREPTLSAPMARRIDVTAETLRDVGVPAEIIQLPDGTPEFQLFWVLHFFDLVSVKIALRAGIDPTPVAMVEDFKRRLKARETAAQAPGRSA